MKTAIAIAQAASMIQSMEVIISVRGTVTDDRRGGESPLMWIIFDSRIQKLSAVRERLYAPQPTGSTPEGLCFQAIQKEIQNDAKGKDMYFINVSDGQPGFERYSGMAALKHTAEQVNEFKKNNINVLSFFVSDNDYESVYVRSAFNTMYGKDSQYIDTNNLSQLAKSLNNLFVRKNS